MKLTELELLAALENLRIRHPESVYILRVASGIVAKCFGYIKTDNYRRLKPLLEYLKAFDKTQWEDLIVVHYGY